jgi:hypothetical protein
LFFGDGDLAILEDGCGKIVEVASHFNLLGILTNYYRKVWVYEASPQRYCPQWYANTVKATHDAMNKRRNTHQSSGGVVPWGSVQRG